MDLTHTKRKRNVNFTPCNKGVIKLHKSLQKLTTGKVALIPGSEFTPRQLYDLFRIWELRTDSFFFEGMPPVSDYRQWLQSSLNEMASLAPWFFAVTISGEIKGAVFLHNWEMFGPDPYAVEFSGFADKKVDPLMSVETIRLLAGKVFEETQVRVIRTIHPKTNRAATWATLRSGFKSPCYIPYWRCPAGAYITGTMVSMTREDFMNGQVNDSQNPEVRGQCPLPGEHAIE